MKQDNTQEQLKELFREARNYYGLQKDYLKLTITEKLTLLLGKMAIAVILGLLSLFVILFLGMALVHWIGNVIGNLALCYAGFGCVLTLAALLFYANRRRLVILPLARMFAKAILETKSETPQKEQTDGRDED